MIRLVITDADLDACNNAGLVSWNEINREKIAQAVRIIVDEWRTNHE